MAGIPIDLAKYRTRDIAHINPPARWHIVPVGGKHLTNINQECWCCPDEELQPNGAVLVIHHREN